MNVDDAARQAVRALREQVVRVPDVERLVLRGRRQRVRKHWATTVMVAAVVTALVPIALVASADRAPRARIIVGGSSLPAGVTTEEIQAGWSRVPNAVAVGSFVQQAAAGSSGFVAVGDSCVAICRANETTIPAIWYSPDGSSWTRVAAEAIPSSGTKVDAVAYWHDQYWAISEGDAGAPVWTSSDGQVWTAQSSPTPALSLSANESPYRLVADQLGLLVYTSAGAAFSTDGRTWQTTDLPRGVSAITRFGSELVALVDVPAAQGSGRAVVFTSSDGLHWTQVDDLGAVVDPGSTTVTDWNGELWAVSYPGGSAAASLLWRSTDGISWSHPDASVSPPGTVFDQLVPMGAYLVATGFDTNSRPGGWVTTDGSHWIPMPDLARPPGGRLDIAASDGHTLVAMSSSGLDDFYRWADPTRTTSAAAPLRVLFSRTTPDGITIVARAGLVPVAAADQAEGCPVIPVPSTQPANTDCAIGNLPGVEFDFSVGGRSFRATVLDRDVPIASGPDLEPMITLADIREVLPNGESVVQLGGPSPYLVVLHATKVAKVRVDPTRTTATGLDEMTPVDGWAAFAAPASLATPIDNPAQGLNSAGEVVTTALPWRCC